MKKIVKRAIVLFIVTLTLFGMVACRQNPIANVINVGAGYEANISGEITWTFSVGNAFEKRAANSFIKAFQSAYPNASVKLDASSSSAVRVNGGTIGDVFHFSETQIYEYAVTCNGLMPLEGYVAALEMDLSDVYMGIFELGKIDGRLYYVSRDYNAICFTYNKDKLVEHNLDSMVKNEWAWSDLLHISKTITEATSEDNELFYGANIDLTYSPVYVTFFESAVGGTWCNTEEKKITFIDEDGRTLQAMQECIDAALAGYINPGASSVTKGTPVFKYCVHPQVLAQGNDYDTAGVDWDIVAFPGFGENGENRGFGCGSSGFGVYNRTRNQDTAAAFALYFYTEDGQRAYNGQPGASVPVIGSLKDDSSWRYPDRAEQGWDVKNWDAFVFEAQTASIVGQVVCRMPYEIANKIETEMDKIIPKVMAGNISLDNAFTELQTTCNDLWSTLVDY